MENKELYGSILKKALLFLLIISVVTCIIVKDGMYVISTLFGGCLSILGFISIILMAHSSLEGNVKARFTSAYMIRYLIYFVAMFIGAKVGLNILSMLLGFLCINLAIKMDTFLKRKEES